MKTLLIFSAIVLLAACNGSEAGNEAQEAQTFVSLPGMIEGYGGGGGVQFCVLDLNGNGTKELKNVTDRLTDRLAERKEFAEVYSSYDINYPQYLVNVDVSQCKKAGVSPATVLNELGAYLGGDYVSNFNKFNKVYQVMLQLRATDRATTDALNNIFVRTESGGMCPVSRFVTLTKEFLPQSLGAFNMSGCIDVSGSIPQGGSTGDAIKAVSDVANSVLPMGYKVEFDGISREESSQGNRVAVISAVCLLFVYLVMVALYESLISPLVVLLAVPFGVAGSFALAALCGVENNIYFQVGLIMLMGLLAKTAILLTEYADENHKAGMSVLKSALLSAKMRLRPVLMTSLTMIFGMLPLMFSTGAGANGSRTIGVCIVGGMLLGTIGLLLAVPVIFGVFKGRK